MCHSKLPHELRRAAPARQGETVTFVPLWKGCGGLAHRFGLAVFDGISKLTFANPKGSKEGGMFFHGQQQ